MKDVVSGLHSLSCLALPWRLDCSVCDNTSLYCSSVSVASIFPLDAIIPVLDVLPSDRLIAELPFLLERLVNNGSWHVLSQLCKSRPLLCSSILARCVDIPWMRLIETGYVSELYTLVMVGICNVDLRSNLYNAQLTSTAMASEHAQAMSYFAWFKGEATIHGCDLIKNAIVFALRAHLPTDCIQYVIMFAKVGRST